MKCKVLLYNSIAKKSEWIDGIITGMVSGYINENFQRVNIKANGIEYIACHPHCVKEELTA
jgi:hypothetical protein